MPQSVHHGFLVRAHAVLRIAVVYFGCPPFILNIEDDKINPMRSRMRGHNYPQQVLVKGLISDNRNQTDNSNNTKFLRDIHPHQIHQ